MGQSITLSTVSSCEGLRPPQMAMGIPCSKIQRRLQAECQNLSVEARFGQFCELFRCFEIFGETGLLKFRPTL
jgi:hypothetical protein